MERTAFASLATTFLVASQMSAFAAAPERWTATSTTASAITGNVTFASDKITFANGKSLPLSDEGRRPAFTGMGHQVAANLYRVTTPADLTLIGGNHLCNGKVTFIVVWLPKPIGSDVAPKSMAAFSGHQLPASDTDGQGLCGTYNYEAGRKR